MHYYTCKGTYVGKAECITDKEELREFLHNGDDRLKSSNIEDNDNLAIRGDSVFLSEQERSSDARIHTECEDPLVGLLLVV